MMDQTAKILDERLTEFEIEGFASDVLAEDVRCNVLKFSGQHVWVTIERRKVPQVPPVHKFGDPE